MRLTCLGWREILVAMNIIYKSRLKAWMMMKEFADT
jgi:hypothetical protein